MTPKCKYCDRPVTRNYERYRNTYNHYSCVKKEERKILSLEKKMKRKGIIL